MVSTRLEITLKSGAKVEADVETWKWTRNDFKRSLEWTTPDGAERRLVTMEMDEVAAIVEVTDAPTS